MDAEFAQTTPADGHVYTYGLVSPAVDLRCDMVIVHISIYQISTSSSQGLGSMCKVLVVHRPFASMGDPRSRRPFISRTEYVPTDVLRTRGEEGKRGAEPCLAEVPVSPWPSADDDGEGKRRERRRGTSSGCQAGLSSAQLRSAHRRSNEATHWPESSDRSVMWLAATARLSTRG